MHHEFRRCASSQQSDVFFVIAIGAFFLCQKLVIPPLIVIQFKMSPRWWTRDIDRLICKGKRAIGSLWTPNGFTTNWIEGSEVLLRKCIPEQDPTDIIPETIQVNPKPITLHEMSECVIRFRPKKAPGLDGK